jgi:hypothetical protein
MSLVGAIGGASRRQCVVLVPVGNYMEPDCEAGLAKLESRGYSVRRVYGYANIDQGRSQMASDALADGFHELMWIDSDVAFDPDDVDRMRSHGRPIVCGIYPKKGQRALACNLLPDTPRVTFGAGGGLLEIEYAATGFLLTRKEVYADVARACELPACNTRFGRPLTPYFLPMIIQDRHPSSSASKAGDTADERPTEPTGHWYLGDDYAFCERCRRAGHRIYADTTIRLFHVGRYRYSWEDAGTSLSRYDRFDFHVGGGGDREKT